MNQILWDKVILEEFKNLACLTDTELEVLNCRIAGYSRVKTAFKCHMSDSNVDKIIRKIRTKYDGCQTKSDILPIRKKSKRENSKQSV